MAEKEEDKGFVIKDKRRFSADEETGSTYGTLYLLEHLSLFHETDLILIPDGGDAQGSTIEIAEKNLLWLRITTKGTQTHGSRPDQGSNAHLDVSARLATITSEVLLGVLISRTPTTACLPCVPPRLVRLPQFRANSQ